MNNPVCIKRTPKARVVVKPIPKAKVAAAKEALDAEVAVLAAAAKPAAPKAAKPTSMQYTFTTDHVGPSKGINERPSRVAIDFTRFGSLADHALSDRDSKFLATLREEFGNRQFERGNLDAGLLKRLGQRGKIAHVRGSDVDPKAVFRITKAA